MIFRAALKGVDPGRLVGACVRTSGHHISVGGLEFRVRPGGRVLALGAGKAAGAMAAALERRLGGVLSGGLVVTPYGYGRPTRLIEVLEANHPVPDSAGVRAARKLLAVARDASENDLVIVLLSGGASALLPAPLPGIRLTDKQTVTRLLLASGAPIREVNAVRKHLSAVKGGRLAQALHPARSVTLALSDVPGDRSDVIGSGPTVPDSTTHADCLSILDRHGLADAVPRSVRTLLQKGAEGVVPETPKPGDPVFDKARFRMVGCNRDALAAASRKAQALGYRAVILSSSLEGPAADLARFHAAVVREIRLSGHPVRPPACVLSGGEATVRVTGKGKGGRNQEFALVAAMELAGLDRVAVLSAGSDGIDGVTDAAGAIATGRTAARARALGLDPAAFLADNDSHAFFSAVGGLVVTGPTFTNVMDIRVALVAK